MPVVPMEILWIPKGFLWEAYGELLGIIWDSLGFLWPSYGGHGGLPFGHFPIRAYAYCPGSSGFRACFWSKTSCLIAAVCLIRI